MSKGPLMQNNTQLHRLLIGTPALFKQLLLPTFLIFAYIPSANALPDDKNQPIAVTAGSATMDDTTGITTLRSAVKVVQGSMTITAGTLLIYRDKKGDIYKMVATGKPAHFSQQQKKGQPHTKAWGTKMLYSVTQQTVTITGNARVEQLTDKFSGETVTYHMDRAIVKAVGGKQRVKMVIQPKGKK